MIKKWWKKREKRKLNKKKWVEHVIINTGGIPISQASQKAQVAMVGQTFGRIKMVVPETVPAPTVFADMCKEQELEQKAGYSYKDIDSRMVRDYSDMVRAMKYITEDPARTSRYRDGQPHNEESYYSISYHSTSYYKDNNIYRAPIQGRTMYRLYRETTQTMFSQYAADIGAAVVPGPMKLRDNDTGTYLDIIRTDYIRTFKKILHNHYSNGKRYGTTYAIDEGINIETIRHIKKVLDDIGRDNSAITNMYPMGTCTFYEILFLDIDAMPFSMRMKAAELVAVVQAERYTINKTGIISPQIAPFVMPDQYTYGPTLKAVR